MSNTFNNPIILDTFTSDIDVGDAIYGITNMPFYIEHIEWQTPESTNHRAIVRNALGTTIFDEKCSVAHQSVFKPFNGIIVTGLKIVTDEVESGKISIKLK